ATPPMAGLQLIWATASALMVKSAVRSPSRALARAASAPAWPAPTTTTSKSKTRLDMKASKKTSGSLLAHYSEMGEIEKDRLEGETRQPSGERRASLASLHRIPKPDCPWRRLRRPGCPGRP